jgi:hypothetical protein
MSSFSVSEVRKKVLKKDLRTRTIWPAKNQPKITVGIMDRQTEVTGRVDGNFHGDEFGPLLRGFSVKAKSGMIVFSDEDNSEICRSPSIRLIPTFAAGQTHAAHLLCACL